MEVALPTFLREYNKTRECVNTVIPAVVVDIPASCSAAVLKTVPPVETIIIFPNVLRLKVGFEKSLDSYSCCAVKINFRLVWAFDSRENSEKVNERGRLASGMCIC